MSESQTKTPEGRNMAKRNGEFDPIDDRPGCDRKRRKLEEKEQELSCLEKEAELRKMLEEARAEAELFKLRCQQKEEELEECRKREEGLRRKLKLAKENEELYKRQAEFIDSCLQYGIEMDSPRRRAPPAAAGEEGSRQRSEIVCCSDMGGPAAVCSRCRDEEACVVVLPCNHLCLCLECEPKADKCPSCRSTKTGMKMVLG